ncbi:MAG TPA: hypothetical protein VGL06_22310 [Pseudonocardiaceae bacterium]
MSKRNGAVLELVVPKFSVVDPACAGKPAIDATPPGKRSSLTTAVFRPIRPTQQAKWPTVTVSLRTVANCTGG